ncbi:MAG TPA: hypothetical protein VLU73_02925 [Methylococcaceae bacterium]|nr:hypothetical protein [Methylococcaceae bacterium]
MISCIASLRDPALAATVLSRTPLLYAEGADASLDRPKHVRAGSSLTWFGNRLAVIQDDALFIALIDLENGRVDVLPLPAGEGGLRQFDDLRGNKPFKLDLEACLTIPSPDGDVLLAFGSGSTKRRDSVVRVSACGAIEVIQASELYDRLRTTKAFSGSELNVEGAVFTDGWVRFFNRGNGQAREGLLPVDASCDVLWAELEAYLRNPDMLDAPELHGIVQYDLGALAGVRLTFTDATVTDLGLLYVASAESSPDAITDGSVTGSVIGILDERGGRWTELRDADGRPCGAKVEGICAARTLDGRIYVVIDADDPVLPSELLEVALSGPWTQARPSVSTI